jgi:phosphate transport system substrate-binding protein
MSQRNSTARIAIFLIVGLVIGLGGGYLVTTQTMGSQITSLQNQINQLKANQPNGNIVVKGSDTLLIVGQLWAENYTAQYPGVHISVAGGGSGTGIQAIIGKTTDICDASRAMTAAEVTSAKANGVNPVEWVVGLDGISIVVHPNNPLTVITMQQLELIYNGTYTNWSQVGGNNAPIARYGRQSTSGTYDYFRTTVLHSKNFGPVNELAGNAEIVNSVQNDQNGIGYVGVAYTKQGVNVKVLQLKASDTATPYDPSVANVKSGAYPLARQLYIYTNGFPAGALAGYVSFILGSTGQQILENEGYISYVSSSR